MEHAQTGTPADGGSATPADSPTAAGPRPDARPLNILRVATDLYDDVTGGGAIHAHAMSKRQAEWGHDVTVLTSDHGDPSRPTVSESDGYTTVRHRELARPMENSITPTVVRSLRRRLSEADVVHAHSHLYFSTNVAAAVARLSETPLVVTNHGLVSQTAPKWVQRLFIPTVARFTFNSADRILCYSDTDRDRLRDRSITAPIDVIENGIDCQQFTPGEGNRERYLLYVGRLTDVKGVPVLLEVFDRLAEQYPGLTLRIVGDGPRRGAYERRCRELGIADRVTFVGDVAYDEMARQYRDSLAFVLPSENEGLPRTVLEAMACSVPVVTTALPQLEPVVSGAGYTVEQGAVEGFTDRLAQLVEDERERRELGATGRERVVENYAWTRTVERTTELCYELSD